MAHIINNPSSTVYWAVTNGTVLHVGITSLGEMTETGLGDFIQSSTLDGLITLLEPHKSMLPPLPETEPLIEDQIYSDNGVITAPFRS